ncbi:MAG: hypothetical protein WCG25_10200 [bacterium]
MLDPEYIEDYWKALEADPNYNPLAGQRYYEKWKTMRFTGIDSFISVEKEIK